MKRPALVALAVLFAAATVLYSTIWIRSLRHDPGGRLGFVWEPTRVGLGTVRVAQVAPGFPAARAGVLPGDVLVAVDGRPLDPGRPYLESLTGRRDGEAIELGIERQGQR